MSKPLFRFTVGSCLQQGLDILAESIHRTTEALGVHDFDWVVCYNALNRENLDFIKKAIGNLPVQLYAQNWVDCPIDDTCRSPRRPDGSYEYNGNRCGGTMWKTCPARMRMESHEIVMDNDIVLMKKFPQIDEFLSTKGKTLVLEEPIRFYGRYNHLFPNEGPFLNSGFMGFPPDYDFGGKVRQNWTENGSLSNITQADEQGLLVYTLSREPNIRIQASQMVEILAHDFKAKVTGKEEGVHFTQANRIPSHKAWQQYQKLKANSILI